MHKLSHCIVFVTDLERSTAFYWAMFGFPVTFESPEWTLFATGQTTLALHKAQDPAEPTGGQSRAGTCQFGITVDDLDAFHADVLTKGITCIVPPHMQDFGGRLALYVDPDGLLISVAEAHTKGES
jgi:catechol 2,3-dioxygenase-like lactoylglutathione lyase family enzyme